MDFQDLKKTNVLLVEDDDLDITVVRRFFYKYGFMHPLYFARGGADALSLLRGDIPFASRAAHLIGAVGGGQADGFNPSDYAHEDNIRCYPLLILLDLTMTSMDGFEFLECLRSDPALKHITVFVFSGSNIAVDVEKANSYSVAGYFLKPAPGDGYQRFVSFLNDYIFFNTFPMAGK
jgi:CheY-like chemotaxis protein